MTQEPQKIACMIINRTESYQKISLILIANITAVRVPHTKNFKNGRPDVIKMRFPYTEKNYTGPWPRDYLCDISSNRPSRLGCSKLSQTDRQKHTQTDRKTHRQTTMVHPKIFSHFEWLHVNIKRFAHRPALFFGQGTRNITSSVIFFFCHTLYVNRSTCRPIWRRCLTSKVRWRCVRDNILKFIDYTERRLWGFSKNLWCSQ